MKGRIQILIGSVTIAAGLVLASGCATHRSEAALERQAKVTKNQAQAIALAKVPNGTVKECEIEKEHGKLIWSFDITTPGTEGVTEVNVDALTGDVVGVGHESAVDEAKEGQDND